MMQIHIGAAGRLREPYWLAACEEYRKRLGRFCRLSQREVADTQDPTPPPGFLSVALAIEGERLSSEDFAARLGQWRNDGCSRIAFLIGGSQGLSARAKAQARVRLSLSPMTWPHHMVRAMLFEQLYRACTILEGGQYHK